MLQDRYSDWADRVVADSLQALVVIELFSFEVGFAFLVDVGVPSLTGLLEKLQALGIT